MNQHQRILKELKKAGKQGLSYRDLFHISNCPWKRISELVSKGYVFSKRDVQPAGHLKAIKYVSLVSSPVIQNTKDITLKA